MRVKNKHDINGIKTRTPKKKVNKPFFAFVLALSLISIALLFVGFASNPVTFFAGIPLGICSIKLQDELY